MNNLRQILVCILFGALAALVGSLAVLAGAATSAIEQVPQEIAKTRAALIGEVAATRTALTEQIEGARKDALARIDQQATAAQGNAMTAIREQSAVIDRELGFAFGIADRRLGDTLARADMALAKIEEIRGDAKPALDNSAALVQDLKDSWDDNYFDIKATVESSTVAVTGVARAAEAVGNAAPSVTASVDGIAKSAAKEADALTKPQTFWQSVKSWLLVVSRCAGFFL